MPNTFSLLKTPVSAKCNKAKHNKQDVPVITLPAQPRQPRNKLILSQTQLSGLWICKLFPDFHTCMHELQLAEPTWFKRGLIKTGMLSLLGTNKRIMAFHDNIEEKLGTCHCPQTSRVGWIFLLLLQCELLKGQRLPLANEHQQLDSWFLCMWMFILCSLLTCIGLSVFFLFF